MAAPSLSSTAVYPPQHPLLKAAEKAATLAERLSTEMAERWQKGECPSAHEFLERHTELWDRPEAAVQLIYEEFCLRREYGRESSATEILDRYPQWKEQLQVLLDCHRLLEAEPDAPVFPAVGDSLGDFHLLTELGRGGQGRVFLATQPSLAHRPVVLKITPCHGREHLSLARLQHTHVVPLYSVLDFPDRNLRALCMPYLGNATLERLLRALDGRPQAERTGRDLLDVLDQAQISVPVALPARGPGRQFLARATYVRAVCWIGVCLADALHYAHQRGLVHLDLKPSNVLLSDDGQPMLLDFHLAREPIRTDGPAPDWLGGTPDYMAPEQQEVVAAVRIGRPVAVAVDGRADIYSLGLLLYEALGGSVPVGPAPSPPALHRINPEVTPGLSDLVHKCLAHDPRDRYAEAAALALDLRRHLNDQPLAGVTNRSVKERWTKWRRRRPQALRFIVLLAAALVALLSATAVTYLHRAHLNKENQHTLDTLQDTLAEGRQRMNDRHFAEAVRTLTHGLELAKDLPAQEDLARELNRTLRLARRAEKADELHQVVERLRLFYGEENLSAAQLRDIDSGCRAVWDTRARLVERAGVELNSDLEHRIELDLSDLALLWTDLCPRKEAGESLQVLAEAEALSGANPVIDRQRRALAKVSDRDSPEPVPRTAGQHVALGRYLLHSGEFARADAEFEQAVAMQPQDFWSNFYQGLCACRLGRYQDAVSAFRVCIALAPESAPCYYNRARALAELGKTELALQDYNRALQLDPLLTPAALHRDILRQQTSPQAGS